MSKFEQYSVYLHKPPKLTAMANVISIINTLRMSSIPMRTLKLSKVDDYTISTGNNAVAVRCEIDGREGKWLMKCYFRHKPNLRAIYGKGYHPEELGIYTLGGKLDYIDVVVVPWIEGNPLDKYIGAPNSDYATLSIEFDKLAKRTLDAESAHGDVKPDNIIVGAENKMTLIDLDASWLPSFSYKDNGELGTLMYRHPGRDAEYFNKRIDDYPLAIISTALASLALDRATMEPYIQPDKTLFNPELCIKNRDRALKDAMRIFLEHNDIAHYRIAEGLQSMSPLISDIDKLFGYALSPLGTTIPEGAMEHRYAGLWGYKFNDEWIVPPIFDSCSIPRNGSAYAMIAEKRIDFTIDNRAPIKYYDVKRKSTMPETRISQKERDRMSGKSPRYAHIGNSDNHGKLWSFDEDTLLMLYTMDGWSMRSIARYFARTETAVRARLSKLKIPIPRSRRRRRR